MLFTWSGPFANRKKADAILYIRLVAQMDAHHTRDQKVEGSTPAGKLIMKYYLWSFSPFRWFKKGSCQFLAKDCAQYWLTA